MLRFYLRSCPRNSAAFRGIRGCQTQSHQTVPSPEELRHVVAGLNFRSSCWIHEEALGKGGLQSVRLMREARGIVLEGVEGAGGVITLFNAEQTSNASLIESVASNRTRARGMSLWLTQFGDEGSAKQKGDFVAVLSTRKLTERRGGKSLIPQPTIVGGWFCPQCKGENPPGLVCQKCKATAMCFIHARVRHVNSLTQGSSGEGAWSCEGKVACFTGEQSPERKTRPSCAYGIMCLNPSCPFIHPQDWNPNAWICTDCKTMNMTRSLLCSKCESMGICSIHHRVRQAKHLQNLSEGWESTFRCKDNDKDSCVAAKLFSKAFIPSDQWKMMSEKERDISRAARSGQGPPPVGVKTPWSCKRCSADNKASEPCGVCKRTVFCATHRTVRATRKMWQSPEDNLWRCDANDDCNKFKSDIRAKEKAKGSQSHSGW